MKYDRLIAKTPFFYGWVIVAVATFGLIMSSPGQTYAVSLFIEHFIADLGLSRSVVSSLYSLGTLIGSFALPFIGRMIDRKGERKMIVAISIIFSVALVYMGYVQNALMLALGFILIRMWGQGSLTLVCQIVINQWWVRHRGRIMGIKGFLVSLIGVGAFPTLIIWLIAWLGWRMAFVSLGGFVFITMVPLGWIFFRHKPEEYGLVPDGEVQVKEVVIETNWTRSQALGSSAFWIISISLASIAMLTTGLFFHMISIFNDNQLKSSTVGMVYLIVALVTAIFTLGSGFLIDRMRSKYMLAIALVLQAVALFMAVHLRSVSMSVLYAIVLGATSGLTRTLFSVVWAKYYGRLHLGAITGVSTTVLIVGSALGPMPFGIARDFFGSYVQVFYISSLIPLGLAVACLYIKRPVLNQ